MKTLVACAVAITLAGMAFAVPNDTYATAEDIGMSATGTIGPVDNYDATQSPDDPLCKLGNYGKTMWYKWTAPANGTIQFSTKGSIINSRSDDPLDTVMCVCQLNSNGVPYLSTAFGGDYAFSDDAVDVTSFIELWDIYAGETYYIGIGTKHLYDSASGPIYRSGGIKLKWSYLREMAKARFHAQGGTETTRTLRFLSAYALGQFGDLPVPVRGGYEFLGWFTDPRDGIEVTGDNTYFDVKDYVTEDGYLDLYAHWKNVGNPTPQLQSFSKAQIFTGAFLTLGYGVVGSVEIKVAKKSSKNTAKVMVTVTRYDTGKRVAAKGTLSINADGSATSDDIAIKFKDDKLKDDTMRMTVRPDGTFEMKGAYYLVEAGRVGGALTFDSFTFTVYELMKGSLTYHLPTAPAGFKVIEEALPTNFTFSIVSQGRKFSIPKGTALKYQVQKTPAARPGRVPVSTSPGVRPLKIYELTGLEDSNANKASLKLSYNYKTGLFKGSFQVYMTNGANYVANGGKSEIGRSPKLLKRTIKVVGIVMDSRGFGMSALKETNQEWLTFLVYP